MSRLAPVWSKREYAAADAARNAALVADPNDQIGALAAAVDASLVVTNESHLLDIAAMIASAEEYDWEREETPESWFSHYRKLLAEGQHKEHWGDCTKVPITCERCVSDEFIGRARQVLEKAS